VESVVDGVEAGDSEGGPGMIPRLRSLTARNTAQDDGILQHLSAQLPFALGVLRIKLKEDCSSTAHCQACKTYLVYHTLVTFFDTPGHAGWPLKFTNTVQMTAGME
jgi:hypothetical protein